MVRVYLDTCLLIYLVEGNRACRERVRERILGSLEATFCISDLVRLECRVGPLQDVVHQELSFDGVRAIRQPRRKPKES